MAGAHKNSVPQASVEETPSTQGYFERLSRLIPRLPYAAIDAIVNAILQAYVEDRTVFVFGNGGSAASASHMMCDMNKGTTGPGEMKRLKVLALTDNVPLLTAWANDSGYDQIFSEQLRNFVRPADLAFAISASGNSPNVLRALETAREKGAVTAGVTGFSGGKMKSLCDICAIVPSDNIQMIEDLHHALLHSIFTVVRERLRGASPSTMARAAGRSNK